MEISQSLILDIILAYKMYKNYILSSSFTDVLAIEEIKTAERDVGLRKINDIISKLTENECIELITVALLGQDGEATADNFEDKKLQAQYINSKFDSVSKYLLGIKNLDEYLDMGLRKLT